MKVLAYILTAAAVLIGADVFVMSSGIPATDPTTVISVSPTTIYGGNGQPTPPPD